MNNKLRELIMISLFAALISVLSYVSITLPFSPIPITLQTLGILLAGLLLSYKAAGASVGLWILMGIIGLPVFSGGKSGLDTLLGPTGGYIIGFLICALVIPLLRGKEENGIRFLIVAIIGNFLIIYPLGVLGLMFVTKMPFIAAFMNGVLPFLLGDTIKIIAAVLVSLSLHTHAKKYLV